MSRIDCSSSTIRSRATAGSTGAGRAASRAWARPEAARRHDSASTSSASVAAPAVSPWAAGSTTRIVVPWPTRELT